MAQSRSQPTGAPRRRAHAGTRAVVTVLLAAAVVGTLWVPFYNRSTPALGGFPFYYWYQLIWVPAVAVLSLAAYLLVRRIERTRGASSAASADQPGQAEVS